VTAVRRLGVTPTEFWRMPPRHFWWLFADMQAEQAAAAKDRDRLSDDEKDELIEMLRDNGVDI
jgi:hypothetical protein